MGNKKPPVFPEPVCKDNEIGQQTVGNIKEVIATAYLSTSHQISATSDDRNRILLNWGGAGVMSIANILQKDGIEGRAREAVDWVGNAGAGGFDGNIVVFFKVDTGVLLGRVGDIITK